jgi:hypothetical protein
MTDPYVVLKFKPASLQFGSIDPSLHLGHRFLPHLRWRLCGKKSDQDDQRSFEI